MNGKSSIRICQTSDNEYFTAANTAYKQWRAFGGAMVCASHRSCVPRQVITLNSATAHTGGRWQPLKN